MLGLGTRLQRHDNGEWADIGEVISVTPPAMSRETFEMTEMHATYKTYLAGAQDVGELSLEVNFFDPSIVRWGEDTPSKFANAANHHRLFYDFETGAEAEYRIVFPDKTAVPGGHAYTAWQFLCLVTNFSVSTPANDRMTAAITLKVNGDPTFETVTENY